MQIQYKYNARRRVVAEWSKSVAFKAGFSQRRFESGRRQTVTVTSCTLWQGSLNLSATSPMTTSDVETDVKLNIYLFLFFKLIAPTAKALFTLITSPTESPQQQNDHSGI